MRKSKLVRTLYGLSQKELSRFAKILRSGGLPPDSDAIRLFHYLKKYYPHTGSRKLGRQKAFPKIFGKREEDGTAEWKDGKLRKAMTMLNKKLEDFLIRIELELRPEEREQLLLKAYRRRGNDHDARLILKRSIDEKEKTGQKNGSDFLSLYQLKMQWFSNLKTFKFRSDEKSVEEVMRNLDLFYFDAKLKLVSEMLNRQKTLSVDYEILLKQEVEAIVSNLDDLHLIPTMYINLKMIELLENETRIDTFQEIKAYLGEHIAILPEDDKLETIQRLINYAILAYHNGHVSFLKEQFELYKLALDHYLIPKDQMISDTSFTNIVVAACLMGKFDWVRDFIKNYRVLLPADVRFDAYELSMAYFSFYLADYEDVIGRLRNIKKFLPAYGVRIRSLLLRTYFELFLMDPTYLDLLEAYFRSFHKYIKTHKNLSKDRKEAYFNLIRMVKRFAKHVKEGALKTGKAQLRQDLENAKPVVAKNWLLKKLAAF